MKTLKIDDKWSVEYDPTNNDRPVRINRYGEPSGDCSDWGNVQLAMFYSLLDAPTLPSVDRLAQIIRIVDGSNKLGAAELAERILSHLPETTT